MTRNYTEQCSGKGGRGRERASHSDLWDAEAGNAYFRPAKPKLDGKKFHS